MTGRKLTYPEFKPRPWALAMPWSLTQIEAELRKGLTGSSDTPRYRSFKDTLDAVHLLAHRGVDEFRGDKVHKLLVKAAQTHGWYLPEGKRRPLPKVFKDGHRVCAKCYEEKLEEVFKAKPTLAQKRRNGWAEDTSQLITHKLCDACRLSNARRAKRKAAKREAPTLIGAYRTSITNGLETVAKVFKKHTAFVDTTTNTRSFAFKTDEDGDYYVKREALLRLTRQRLDQYIEDGTLRERIPAEPQGLWFELLTQDEKDNLARLHRAGSWMQGGYRSRMPLLWEQSPHKNASTAKPLTEIKADQSVEMTKEEKGTVMLPSSRQTSSADDDWSSF
jgi:hypothetical protein